MPNYGFAIDLRKCIGCHACTIACKAEHQIPIGVNRCWVKTVEQGSFPRTQRFFFPVLCNQCDDAPCMRICPTNALYKRRDGIVDLDPAACIGCRACMVACPYDQLFIDPNTHTAEKCNFCANRVENELLPACVSVCPTECRIFGDLDDPASEVAQIAAREFTSVRKPEKKTIPKVFYIGAEESVIRPEASTRPFLYKEGQVLLLEHHYQFGGLATWFTRKGGHIFDISLHGFPVGMIKSCRKYWTKEIADSIVQLKDIRFVNPQMDVWTTFTRDDYTRVLVEQFHLERAHVEKFYDHLRAMNFYDDNRETTGEMLERFFPGEIA